MRTKRKVQLFFRRLYKKYMHYSDEPNSELGREWRRHPNFSFNKEDTALFFSMDLEIVRWKHKPHKPWLVGGRGIGLYLNPLKWKFSIYHTWYDGPNCAWNFGLIGFYRHGLGYCKKCSNDK